MNGDDEWREAFNNMTWRRARRQRKESLLHILTCSGGAHSVDSVFYMYEHALEARTVLSCCELVVGIILDAGSELVAAN